MKKLMLSIILFLMLLSLSACGGETLSYEARTDIETALQGYVDTSLGLVTSINPETDDYDVYSVKVDSDLWYAMPSSDQKRVAKTLANHILNVRQTKSKSRVAIAVTFYDGSNIKVGYVSPSGEYSEK